MYSLIRHLSSKQLIFEQLPAGGFALVITEIFFKLHSFTLECVAFLATWLVIDALARGLRGRWEAPNPNREV